MIVCGIDPGDTKSGVVVFDTDAHRVMVSNWCKNRSLLTVLRNPIKGRKYPLCGLYLETIEPMGLRVGRSTFDTMFWVGKFAEAWENATGTFARLVRRGDEKIVLCGRKTERNPKTGRPMAISDSSIRQAIIDRFPPDGGGKTPQVGTKKEPGPLYGVKGHAWSALAVVLTGLELERD
jgi:hypothetical protein